MVEKKMQQLSASNTIVQNLAIQNQTLSPEEPVHSAIPTEEKMTISLKSFNGIWLYLGIGVILLFAFFYFLRMKRKQRNS